MLPRVYAALCSNLAAELQHACIDGTAFISCTADGWSTPPNRDRMMTFTCEHCAFGIAHLCTGQFLTEDFELKQLVLNLAELNEQHTGVNIAELFSKMLKQWTLCASNVVAIATDNAENMKSVSDCRCSHFKAAILQACRTANLHRIACGAHLDSNALKKAIVGNVQMKALIEKCKRIVHFYRVSSVILTT